MPHASTLIRTEPAPGSGISRSTISNGPFARLTCATRIFDIIPPIVCLLHLLTRQSDRNVAGANVLFHRRHAVGEVHPDSFLRLAELMAIGRINEVAARSP